MADEIVALEYGNAIVWSADPTSRNATGKPVQGNLLWEFMEETFQRGLQVGSEQGLKEAALETALQMLIIDDFGSIPETLALTLMGLSEVQLIQVISEISTIKSLDALQRLVERTLLGPPEIQA